MPSTLAKTRKQIAKKRQGNIGALHQGSRDSKRLHKAQVRDERLEKIAASRKKNEQPMSPPAPPFPPFFLGDIKLTQLPKSSASPSFKTQCKRTDTSPSLPRRFSRRSERESQTNLLTSFLLVCSKALFVVIATCTSTTRSLKRSRRLGDPADQRAPEKTFSNSRSLLWRRNTRMGSVSLSAWCPNITYSYLLSTAGAHDRGQCGPPGALGRILDVLDDVSLGQDIRVGHGQPV